MLVKIYHLLGITVFFIFTTFFVLDANALQSGDKIALLCDKPACSYDNRDKPILMHICGNESGNNCPTGVIVTKLDESSANKNMLETGNYDAIIVSESVISTELSWLRDIGVGVMTLEGLSASELAIGSDGGSRIEGLHSPTHTIIGDHEITRPFIGGIVEYATHNHDTGYMQEWDVSGLSNWSSSEAKPLAVFASDHSKAGVLVLEKDDKLIKKPGETQETAPAKRVFFGAMNLSLTNEEGKTIFDRSLDWLLDIDREENPIVIPLKYGAILICKNSSCNASSDQAIINHVCGGEPDAVFKTCPYPNAKVGKLLKIGHTEETKLQQTIDLIDLVGFHKKVVIVSESVDSWQVDWLRQKPINILTLEGSTNDDLGFSKMGSTRNTDGGTKLIINHTSSFHHDDVLHYITRPFESGMLQISKDIINTGYMRNWEIPNEDGPQALAVFTNDPAKAGIVVVDTGQKLHDNTDAQERRVFFSARYFDELTDTYGKEVFDRALEWVIGRPLADPEVTFTILPNVVDTQGSATGLPVKVPIREPYTNSGKVMIIIKDHNPNAADPSISRNIAATRDGEIPIFDKPLTNWGNGVYSGLFTIEWPDPGGSSGTKIYADNGNTVTVEIEDIETLGKIHTTTFEIGPGGVTPDYPEVAPWISLDGKEINCSNDNEFSVGSGDGVCDSWENGGNIEIPITGANNYTFDCAEGCDSNTVDIFVEIDWMQGHYPDEDAIDKIKQTFQNAPGTIDYRIHIQMGEEVMPFIPEIDWDEPTSTDWGFLHVKQANFGTLDERQDEDWWEEHGYFAKKQIFHYVLFAHRYVENPPSTGVAEIHGDDVLITMGPLSGGVGSIDQQAGTLLHELGHNLDLRHGGHDNINCKPNYFSVMNYLKQMSPFDGNYPRFSNLESPTMPILSESNLQEVNVGIAQTDPPDQEFFWHAGSNLIGRSQSNVQDVDWNLQNGVESGMLPPPPIDLNAHSATCNSASNTETLESSNDWSNMVFNFRGTDGWTDDEFTVTGMGMGGSVVQQQHQHQQQHDEEEGFSNELTDDFINEQRIWRLNFLRDAIISAINIPASTKGVDILDRSAPLSANNIGISQSPSCQEATSILEQILKKLKSAKQKIKSIEDLTPEEKLMWGSAILDLEKNVIWEAHVLFEKRTTSYFVKGDLFKSIHDDFSDIKNNYPKDGSAYDKTLIDKLQNLILKLQKAHGDLNQCPGMDVIRDYNEIVDDAEVFLTGRDRVAEAVIFLELLTDTVNADERIDKSQKEIISEEIKSVIESFERDKNFKPTTVLKGTLTNSMIILNGAFDKAQAELCNMSDNECVDPFVVWVPLEATEVAWHNQDRVPHKITCSTQDEDGMSVEVFSSVPVMPKDVVGFEFDQTEAVYECLIETSDANSKPILSYVAVNPHATPEFGEILFLGLVIGTIATIVLSAKSKTKIMNTT